MLASLRNFTYGRRLLPHSWGIAFATDRQLGSLVVVEHKDQKIETSTFNTMVAAKLLGEEVTALVAGHDVDKVAKLASETLGATKVLFAAHASLEHHLAEPMALLVKAVQERHSFSHILMPGTTSGKNILPRAAAQMGIQPVSDVVRVVDKDTFVRPIYAGNALATVQYVNAGVRMLTVRPSSFPCPESPTQSATAELQPVSAEILAELDASAASPSSKFEGEQSSKSERPELASAKVVVCGGRALKSAANFAMLGSLADVLGGAVGASRAAVDAGFVPNDLQVGQTGKVVAPDVYFGIGISGAIQHLAGMKDSKTIVAINTDPEAPIFQVADYGLVQDLFTAVPDLEARLKKLKQGQ